MSKLNDLILGKSPGVDPDLGGATFAEGIITAVDVVDGASYQIPSWDNGKFTFGPSPYPVGVTIAVGFRCLVLMPGNDSGSVAEPWIIGVWPNA